MATDIWGELQGLTKGSFSQKPETLAGKQPAITVIAPKNIRRKKPPIPKHWNAIVFKPVTRNAIRNGKSVTEVSSEGWLEYIEEPEGRPRSYIDETSLMHYFITTKRTVYIETKDNDGNYEPYNPPEFVAYLPEMLHRASKGCDAYSMFLAIKKNLIEKLKTFLMFGIMGMMVFLIFIMLSE